MDKDEALRMALEAFEWNYNTDLDNIPACEKWAKMLKENIAAIKKVLAQPEQEPVAWQGKYRDDEGIPQIAWFPHPVHSKSPLAKRPYTEEPLYTTPSQREWVGLTDEERDHFEGLHLYAARNQVEAWIEGVPAFIDAIEAKLREKNGG